MSKPKVYLPQVPSRFDRGTHLWMPTINLDPARQYGEVLPPLLPPEATRLHDSPEMLQMLREKMKSFSENDFLCCVGDPGILAFAAITAASRTGGNVKLLKWDRFIGNGGGYIVLNHKAES